jgi:hypothetical protein
MSLNELLPSVQTLPRSDKLRLLEWLASDLAREEEVALLTSKAEYSVWSPHDAHEAAAALSAFLEREKAARG